MALISTPTLGNHSATVKPSSTLVGRGDVTRPAFRRRITVWVNIVMVGSRHVGKHALATGMPVLVSYAAPPLSTRLVSATLRIAA